MAYSRDQLVAEYYLLNSGVYIIIHSLPLLSCLALTKSFPSAALESEGCMSHLCLNIKIIIL